MAMPTLLLLLLLQLMALVRGGEETNSARLLDGRVCYQGLGCYENGGNFYHPIRRPISRLPKSPEEIGVTFMLYTRLNPEFAHQIKYNATNSLHFSKFNATKGTKLITHGFTDSVKSGWMEEMKDALLRRGDYNVILIDWSGGNWFPYSQAAANTRVVGAVIGRLISWMEAEIGAERSRFHIIGHSLGAHVAGYAGEWLQGKLGRITGMDPAGPYFSLTPTEVKLDPSDAQFVDVIHTDGEETMRGGFGLIEPLGHVDFYPNGGKLQRGCDRNPLVSIIEEGTVFTITCSHNRVMPLMIGTITNPHGEYNAVVCRSYTDFKKGRCSCDSNDCASMGIDADKWQPRGRQHVKMYIDTTDTPPYSTNHYYLRVRMSDKPDAKRQFGELSVDIRGMTGKSTGTLLALADNYFVPGQVKSALLITKNPVKHVQWLLVMWRNTHIIPNSKATIALESLEVTSWGSGKKTRFCMRQRELKTGQWRLLKAGKDC